MSAQTPATVEKIRKFLSLLREEANSRRKSLELSNDSPAITFIIAALSDIFAHNLATDGKFDEIYATFRENLDFSPTISFVDSLNYLGKGSQRLHLLLFLEFSRKSLDVFFEKLLQNRNILRFFSRNSNEFLPAHGERLRNLFATLKEIPFTVKSAVLQHFCEFLQRNSNFPAFPKKRAVTPHLIATVFDDKYEWKIKVSPKSRELQGKKQFFSRNHQKKSSFDVKVQENSKENLKKARFLQFSLQIAAKLRESLRKRRKLLETVKTTQISLQTLRVQLSSEISQCFSSFPREIARKAEIFAENGEIVKENPAFDESFAQSHQKNSSKNKLSFGLQAFSHENLESCRQSAISPKFEAGDAQKTSFCSVFPNNSCVFQRNAGNPEKLPTFETESSTFEEEKAIFKKNSEVLFREKFEKACKRRYKEKPSAKRSLEDQLFLCYSCHATIPKSLIFWNHAYYCNYLGFWYCSQCFCKEKRPLWWKVLEEFDVTRYEISNDARKEIDELLRVANLTLKNDGFLVRNHRKLEDFLKLKRKIHKMYDLVCEPAILLDMLQDRANLALQQNLLSLADFLEISDGSLLRFAEKVCFLAENHIFKCKECQKRGVSCKICHAKRKIFAFEENVRKCRKCRDFYHEKCFAQLGCLNCALPAATRKRNHGFP